MQSPVYDILSVFSRTLVAAVQFISLSVWSLFKWKLSSLSDVSHCWEWRQTYVDMTQCSPAESVSLSLPSDSTPLNNWLEIGPQRQSRLYSAAREQLLVVEMALFGWCHCGGGGGGCRPRPWWWWWCGKTAVTTSCSLHFSRLLNSPVCSLHTPRVAQTPFWLTWSPHRAPPSPLPLVTWAWQSSPLSVN